MQKLVEKDILEILPEEVHQRCTLFINELGENLHNYLISEEKCKIIEDIPLNILNILRALLALWDSCIVFSYHVTRMFMQIHPQWNKTFHQWIKSVYLDEDQQEIWENAVQNLFFNRNTSPLALPDNKGHIWTCNLLCLLLRRKLNLLADPLALKLFENLQFRGILGILNVQLYDHLNKPRFKESGIVQYGLQTFWS